MPLGGVACDRSDVEPLPAHREHLIAAVEGDRAADLGEVRGTRAVPDHDRLAAVDVAHGEGAGCGIHLVDDRVHPLGGGRRRQPGLDQVNRVAGGEHRAPLTERAHAERLLPCLEVRAAVARRVHGADPS